MKMQELEKLIEKLRYYNTDKFITNYSEYIKNLDEQSIKNILSMNYDRDIYLDLKKKNKFEWENVFLNPVLLKSNDFNKILDLFLVNLKERVNKQSTYMNYVNFSFKEFYKILRSEEAWKYGYIIDDLESIVDSCKNLIDIWSVKDCSQEEFSAKKQISDYIVYLAIDEKSLSKTSHEKAIDMLRNYTGSNLGYSNLLAKANAIYEIQTSDVLSDGELCEKYFDIINKIDSNKIIEYVKHIMLKGKTYDKEINYIINAKSEDIATIIFRTLQTILSSEDFEKYKDTYLYDLNLISKARNLTIAEELKKVALSLDSIAMGKNKHKEHMLTIAYANNVYKAKSFSKVVLNNKYDDLDAILFNAQRFVDSNGDDMDLPDHVFKVRRKTKNTQ